MRLTAIGALAACCLLLTVPAFAGDGGDGAICEPCTGPCDATIIPTPAFQTVSGTTVGDPNIERTYCFCAVAGATYTFSTCPATGGGNASYDSAISVHSAACGASLGCDDDACDSPSLASILNWTAGAGGNYIVRVHGFGGGTGTFTLAYRGETCLVPVEPSTWGMIKSTYSE
jgi:hypothetical protein